MSEFEETILNNVNDMFIDNHFTISKSEGEMLFIETDRVCDVVLSTIESDYKNIGIVTADDGVVIYKDTPKIEPYLNYYALIYDLDDIDELKETMILDDNINISEKVTLVRTASVLLGAMNSDNSVEDNLKTAAAIYEDDIDIIINTIKNYGEEISE